MPAVRLYKNVTGIPKKIIEIYEYASSIISSGVCIISNIWKQNILTNVVITIAKMAERIIEFPTNLRIES